MDTDDIRVDENGIPVLDEQLAVEPAAVEQAPPAPAPLDAERLRELLQTAAAREMLDDLTEDLQQTVLWKIESILKEELGKVIQETVQQSAPRIRQDIHTQLELALPDLLAQLAENHRS